MVFKLPLEEAMKLVRHGLITASNCRIKALVQLARTILEYIPLIETTLTYRLTDAGVEV